MDEHTIKALIVSNTGVQRERATYLGVVLLAAVSSGVAATAGCKQR